MIRLAPVGRISCLREAGKPVQKALTDVWMKGGGASNRPGDGRTQANA